MTTRLLVLGAGTAGSVVANKLRRRHSLGDLRITVVDHDETHHYQPGYLFVPFNSESPKWLSRPRRSLLKGGVEFICAEVDRVVPDENVVVLDDGSRVHYDSLVIATGTSIRPEQTAGMLGTLWRNRIFDFYSYGGALALRDAWQSFDRGRLVVHTVDMPIKCPVAPLEFAFLADAALRRRKTRDRVALTYVTPLPGAFTKPLAAQRLGSMLDTREIQVESDFLVERIDTDTHDLVSYDGRRIGFDLLVTVPLNMGAEFVARSGLGDELNYVSVDPKTLQAAQRPNIYAIGDANDVPTSKSGSAAHFAAETFVKNFTAMLHGRSQAVSFDGHANCFIESGQGKGLLIDFNYDVEPLPGLYPMPHLGPFRLLAESRVNHWGKRAFRWLYWNALLPGRPLPVPRTLSMAGKHDPKEELVS